MKNRKQHRIFSSWGLNRYVFTALGTAVIVIVLTLFATPASTAERTKTLPDGVRTMKLSFTTIFFIPCTGGYLQIDCSYPDDYKKYLDGLGELHIDPSEIKYLFLTHHHDDHAGFAAALIEDNPGVRLIVHENGLEYLARGVSEDISAPLNGCVRFLLGSFSLFHRFNFPPIVLRENDIIITGDDETLLRSIGIDGSIITTPGHTTDSISIVMRDGSAYVGDAAMNFLKICRCRHLPIYVIDQSEVYRSWEKLREYGAQTIYPAHGDPFDVLD
jgi:glyoxylase-like metal-dependent hydrolase (beta-lactamase superfamily II)